MLREACRTAATWPEHLTVAVNLSPAQFVAGNVSDIVAAALKEAGLAPHRLELEITETLLLGNSEAIMTELRTLKAMGVAIVMDDFGTGYSSLSYLVAVPVRQDQDRPQLHAGLRRVRPRCRNGGEDNHRARPRVAHAGDGRRRRDRQAGRLSRRGDGDQAQGFFFGRPIPASEVAASILDNFQKTLPRPAGDKDVKRRPKLSAVAT